MKRTDLLNHLIRKHGLKRYLEIGLQDATQNFDKVQAEYKISVDPEPNAHATFCMTSDEFFEQHLAMPRPTADLIFIDGLHTAEQVRKDFENALKILSPNGFIVLHDCNPEKEEHTIVPRPTERGHWNGDVYKFASSLQFYTGINGCTVDIDNGCAVVRKTGEFGHCGIDSVAFGGTTWEYFDSHRKFLLNLITWDEFIKI